MTMQTAKTIVPAVNMRMIMIIMKRKRPSSQFTILAGITQYVSSPKRNKNIDRAIQSTERLMSCNFLTVAETCSPLPSRREASRETRRFFPSASFVGPIIETTGTMKPKRRIEVMMTRVGMSQVLAFYITTNSTSLNPSLMTNAMTNPSTIPGIAKLNACTTTNLST